MVKPWKWLGNDRDEQCGGIWVRPCPEHGYADVVRVTPFSDAGGHNNHFWVECLTVYGMDEEDKRKQVLDTMGYDCPAHTLNPYWLADAFVQYGFTDLADCYPNSCTETVQLGTSPDKYSGHGWGPVEITVQLRANASIKRYARRLARERM